MLLRVLGMLVSWIKLATNLQLTDLDLKLSVLLAFKGVSL